MPLFCSDINLYFQFIMLGRNCAKYDHYSTRSTPVVSQYMGNTKGTTTLSLLLVVGKPNQNPNIQHLQIIPTFTRPLSSIYIE